jgi:hypothetical protein
MRTITPLSARGDGASDSWFVSGMKKPKANGRPKRDADPFKSLYTQSL